MAAVCQRSADQLVADLADLLEAGIARIEGGRLHLLSEAEAVAHLLTRQAQSHAATGDRLTHLASAIPLLMAKVTGPDLGEVSDVSPLDGEKNSGGNAAALLSSLILESAGDLMWWRPDAWRMPREPAMAELVARAVATGRRSRAIYPNIALQEAPEALQARALAGEQIRVVAELPSRLLVIGTTLAIIPEPLGANDEPRLLLRQPALVEALTMLFELTWQRASPVPGLERGVPRPDLRRMLLEQLAKGAKDEAIARTLGISLRTVRRRIADIQIELGVDSRFQTGVEAVRRGWL